MKKIVRVSVVVLVVAILVVLAAPALAGGRGGSFFDTCHITPPYWNKDGEVERGVFSVPGNLSWWITDEGELVNECKGNAPLGEDINHWATWLTFDETCTETSGTCDDEGYYVDNELVPGQLKLVNPDTNKVYWTEYYTFEMDSDGFFTLTKTY